MQLVTTAQIIEATFLTNGSGNEFDGKSYPIGLTKLTA